jgi:polysaccharide biosynthesis/export protein ExoF
MSLTSTRKTKPRSSSQRTMTDGRMLLLGFIAAGAFGTVALETSSSAGQIADRLVTLGKGWPPTFPQHVAAIMPLGAPKAAPAELKLAAATDQPQVVATAGSKLSAREETPVVDPELNVAGGAPSAAFAAGHAIGRSAFQLGDKLKIAFYEQVDLQDDRWAKSRSNRPGLQQRTELTGEYVVQPDGTISLPLFGLVQAAGRSSQELQADLESAFHDLTGRKGFVTAVVLEHQPIYVLGPVKNPGSYKYASGMTVFHAIALAGGLDRATLGTWQEVEGLRAAEKQQASVDHLIRLLARVAVLKAERDGTPLKASVRLVELAGELRAKNALNLEIDRREVTVMSNRARESTLEVSIENAKQEIESLSGRVPVVDANVKLRDDRVNRMRVLANRNVVDNVVVDQAQAELLNVQERRQEMVGSILLAKQRLSLAEQERVRHQTEVRTELEQTIERVEQESTDVERDLTSSEGVLKAISVSGMRTPDAPTEDTIAFEIVRHTAAGTTVLSATGTTDVEPGDLVRLRVPHETTEPRAPRTMRAGKITTDD